MVGSPDLGGIPGTVDVGLAVAGGAADGQLLQGAAEAAHGVALEVGQDQHGIIVCHVLAHIVLVNFMTFGNVQHHVWALGVQQVNVKMLAPAVLFEGSQVLLGGVPGAFVGGVAFYHRAGNGFDHGLPEVRPQEILVAFLAGVQLHGNLAGQGDAQSPVKLHDLLGSQRTGEINLGWHNTDLLFK